jgi:hypothetical protein
MSWVTHSIQQLIENDISSFFVGFAARFNTVVHKQVVTKRGAGAPTPQHG